MALRRPALLAQGGDEADWLPSIQAALSCGMSQPPKNHMMQTMNVLFLRGNLEACTQEVNTWMLGGKNAVSPITECRVSPHNRLKSGRRCWQWFIQVMSSSYLHVSLDSCLLLLILIFLWQVRTTFFVNIFPLNVYFPHRLGKTTHVALESHTMNALHFNC